MTHTQENALVTLITASTPKEISALLTFFCNLRFNCHVDHAIFYSIFRTLAALKSEFKPPLSHLSVDDAYNIRPHIATLKNVLNPTTHIHLRELCTTLAHLQGTLVPALNHVWEQLAVQHKLDLEHTKQSHKDIIQEAILQ